MLTEVTSILSILEGLTDENLHHFNAKTDEMVTLLDFAEVLSYVFMTNYPHMCKSKERITTLKIERKKMSAFQQT